MNAIELLKRQHRRTKAALAKGCEGKLDRREAKAAADELVAHMVIEEHVFYPRVRQLLPDIVAEAYEEHTVARFALARCLTARTSEETKIRFLVLKELVGHHIEEEERELLPKVEKGLPRAELEALGNRMQTMFDRAVAAGLDALVQGPAQELRRPDAGNGARRRPVAQAHR
jgi:hypothetical protein